MGLLTNQLRRPIRHKARRRRTRSKRLDRHLLRCERSYDQARAREGAQGEPACGARGAFEWAVRGGEGCDRGGGDRSHVIGRGLSVLSNNYSRLTRTSRRTFLTSSHLQVSALISDLISHFRSAPFPGTLLTCHYLSRTKLHKSQPQISPYTSPYISTILDLSRMFIIISIVFIDPLCLHLGYYSRLRTEAAK